MVSIYILINPLNEKVFYVGATMYPESRLMAHVYERGATYKHLVIKRILNYKLHPEMVILEEVEEKDACITEQFYIDLFKFYGFKIPQKKSGYCGNKSYYKEWLKENKLCISC